MQTKRKGYSFALLAKQVIFSAGRIKVPKCNWKFKSQAFTFLDKKKFATNFWSFNSLWFLLYFLWKAWICRSKKINKIFLQTICIVVEISATMIYSPLSRCSTARGSSNGLSIVGPTKVQARKSFLFTEVSPEVENKIWFLKFHLNLRCCELCCLPNFSFFMRLCLYVWKLVLKTPGPNLNIGRIC